MNAAELGETNWVRVASNMAVGAYGVFKAPADYPDPVWPDGGLDTLVNVAFEGRYIGDWGHPVLRRLRDEI